MKRPTKRGVLRTVAGFAAYSIVWWTGAAVGIKPSLAEALLVIAACAALEFAEAFVAAKQRRSAGQIQVRIVGDASGMTEALRKVQAEVDRKYGGQL